MSVPKVDRIGRRRGSMTVLVLPEHEAELRAHVQLVERYGVAFLIGVVALGVASLALALLAELTEIGPLAIRLTGVLVAAMGLLVIALPFATPETTAFFGIRRSILIARVAGAMLLVLGIGIALLG